MRLYFIDNARVVLTILVVLHHVGLTYAGRSGWYFYQPTDDPATKTILLTLLAVNRAFFMGFFFFVSGYFTPGSFDRKGTGRFIRDRLLRLGVPLVVFSFFIRPILVYTMNYDTLGPQYGFWANILEFRNVAPGPLWFVETLLIFSGFYVIWRLTSPKPETDRAHETGEGPGTGAIICFILLLTLATFLIRIYFPPSFQIFRLRIGNYAQYISLYIIGMVAYRKGWLSCLTDRVGRLWIPFTSIVLIVFVAMTVVSIRAGTLSLLSGGLHWQAMVQALLESSLCVGLIISILFVFSRKWNFQGRLTAAMAGDAYTVYIMHAPVLVYLSYFVQPLLPDHPLIKFCSVSVAAVGLTFLVSHFLRELPYAKKVL